MKPKIDGLVVVEPRIFHDSRGLFFESYQSERYQELGIKANFVQDNESLSARGVVRGLHLQTGNFEQAKLVRVVKGSVWDVAVDLRPNSETYGQYFGIELSEHNYLQMFIPRGFAHGFVSLENDTIFQYKCDNYYNKDSEAGIIYNDADLNIDWKLPANELIISEKDMELPFFKDFQA